MFPELFPIGPIPVRAYGLMLALSFLAGVWYISRMSARDGKSPEQFLTIAYILIIGGVVGARLSYIVLHLSEFAGNWGATFNPFASDSYGIAGLNMYGGVVLGVVGAVAYCRLRKIPILESLDYFAPTVGIGLGLTRVGCFLNGCCFGTPTDLPWGVMFPGGSIPSYIFPHEHLHPAQLYSSLYGIGLFVLLHLVMKRKQFHGQLLALLFMIEAVFRFGIEYVRYYEDAMYFEVFGYQPTWNMVASVGLFAVGLVIYIVQSRRARATVS